MASTAQMQKAWRHLWDDPLGFQVRLAGDDDSVISVTRQGVEAPSANVKLQTIGPSDEDVAALTEIGWRKGYSRLASSFSAFSWRDTLRPDDDPLTFFELAKKSLTVVSDWPEKAHDLRINVVDATSDAGWAQAGCAFALPGMAVGGFVGLLAWIGSLAEVFANVPLGDLIALFGLAITPVVGASLAFFGGGLLASATFKVVSLTSVTRRSAELLSYGGYFVGSLATGIALGVVAVVLAGD